MPLHALVQPSAWHSVACLFNLGMGSLSRWSGSVDWYTSVFLTQEFMRLPNTKHLPKTCLNSFCLPLLMGICGLCHACHAKCLRIITENLNLNPETHCLWTITVLKLWFHSLETVNSGFSQFSFFFSLSQVGNRAFWIRHWQSHFCESIVSDIGISKSEAAIVTKQAKLTRIVRIGTFKALSSPMSTAVAAKAVLFEFVLGNLQQSLGIVIIGRCRHHGPPSSEVSRN